MFVFGFVLVLVKFFFWGGFVCCGFCLLGFFGLVFLESGNCATVWEVRE